MEMQVLETRTKRLIVLVPDYQEARTALAHKIFGLAAGFNTDVIYLTLRENEQDELALSRCMTTLIAQTAGQWLNVSWKHANAADWVSALQTLLKPNDVIVCHAEQMVETGFARSTPLNEYLRHTLRASTHTITGFYHPPETNKRGWQDEMITWLGFLVILLVFTWLEIQLDLAVGGAAGKLMVVIIVCLEFSAVLAWNSIT